MISFQEFKELVKTNASLQNRYKEKLKSCIDSSDNVTVQEVVEAELYEGKFVDEDFARWCNRHNMKWCDSNFFVGNDVTTLSNCCRLLSDTTKVKASGFINSIGGTS